IADLKMPEMDGLQFLGRVRLRAPSLPLVLMTAHASIPSALEALRNGVDDYLVKPFSRNEAILVAAARAVERGRDKQRPRPETEATRSLFPEIIGASKRMQEVFLFIQRVARIDAPVLVLGESGTGKELVARALHDASKRRSQPFVAVNCAAIADTLL